LEGEPERVFNRMRKKKEKGEVIASRRIARQHTGRERKRTEKTIIRFQRGKKEKQEINQNLRTGKKKLKNSGRAQEDETAHIRV